MRTNKGRNQAQGRTWVRVLAQVAVVIAMVGVGAPQALACEYTRPSLGGMVDIGTTFGGRVDIGTAQDLACEDTRLSGDDVAKVACGTYTDAYASDEGSSPVARKTYATSTASVAVNGAGMPTNTTVVTTASETLSKDAVGFSTTDSAAQASVCEDDWTSTDHFRVNKPFMLHF